MKSTIFDLVERAGSIRNVIRGAALGLVMMPLGAAAEMNTLSNGELAALEEIEGSGYQEYYQHPDMGNFRFSSIYIAPVENAMPVRQIYDQRLRPEYIDQLTLDFHDIMVTAFEATGLLTDTPDENTLVISPTLIFVTEYDEETTGSHLDGARVQDRLRGSTIMEMSWRAGPGGQLVAAFRDGRSPQIYAPVTDREDRFTDAKDTFRIWATEFASFFGADNNTEMN